MHNKTVGILGGMGPDATHYFYQKLTAMTSAEKDQEHLPVLMYSNPKLPDRATAVLSGRKKELIEGLQYSVSKLEKAGADFIVIPCNTAHYFVQDMQSVLSIPILNMIDLTAAHIAREGTIKRVGLLGTTATVKWKLYDDALKPFGVELICPNDFDQNIVMFVIDEVKAGRCNPELKEKLDPLIESFRKQGVQKVILGCTELPMVFESMGFDYFIDPMDILAEATIEKAGGVLKMKGMYDK